MTWCNESDVNDHIKLNEEIQTIKCPSCGHDIEVKNQVLIKYLFI